MHRMAPGGRYVVSTERSVPCPAVHTGRVHGRVDDETGWAGESGDGHQFVEPRTSIASRGATLERRVLHTGSSQYTATVVAITRWYPGFTTPKPASLAA
jgi:hypothetical protein